MKSIDTPAERSLLEEVVQRLVEAFDPDEIFFFGSRAREEAHEESDYDFMVVVDDEAPPETLERNRPYEVLSGVHLDFEKDVKVWTRSQFTRQLHLRASMPSTVLREGRVLYLRPGATPLRGPDRWAEAGRVCEPEQPYDPVRVENTSTFVKLAGADLEAAALLVSAGSEALRPSSLFHSQQAAEKIMKAFLFWHDHPAQRSHDLEKLREDCLNVDSTLEEPLGSVHLLKRGSLNGRYLLARVSMAEAKEGLQIAQTVLEAVLERLPECVPRACVPAALE
ncbi:MAG TPA: HEPN domain-containing protein [Candidatus Obscuribacterales bacterium]